MARKSGAFCRHPRSAILTHAQPVQILVLIQVVFSIQLPFAILPLVVNRPWIRVVIWPAAIRPVLNLLLLGHTSGGSPGG